MSGTHKYYVVYIWNREGEYDIEHDNRIENSSRSRPNMVLPYSAKPVGITSKR